MTSVANGTRPRPSTRSIVADDGLCAQVAECLEIPEDASRKAFSGEPVAEVLGMVEWAMKHRAEADEEFDAKSALLSWAMKRGRGAWSTRKRSYRRPGTEEDREKAERVAKTLATMWAENPASLADAILALEAERNGNGRS